MGIGDSGRPWSFVLLGATGSGKSSVGNVLLEQDVFKIGHSAKSCTTTTIKQVGLISSLNVPIVVIDTPGYGDSDGKDSKHMYEVSEVLAAEEFVNAFLLVLNGASLRCDDQIFNMVQAYISMFGLKFFSNMVVIVTHWEMSKKACQRRERHEITQSSFQESWVQQLQSRIDTSLCDHVIPFVFIDTEATKDDTEASEEERLVYEQAKLKIFEVASGNSLFPCLRLDADIAACNKFRSYAILQGLQECSKCMRYYYPSLHYLTREILASACITTISTQGTLAAARIARVVQATEKLWHADAVIRAMTRGWTANTGVHLFGKAASRAGTLMSVGVGVYRLCNGSSNTERVQAFVGTGAGLAGGYFGASTGVSVGTVLCPGIGTVIGGVVGGLVGSFGAQVAAERCVTTLSDSMDAHLCPCCKIS